MKSFAACFADLPDPSARNVLHNLRELLFIALLDAVRGEQCVDMALFCAEQGIPAEAGPDIAPGTAQSRHFQPRLPDARPEGLRTLLSAEAANIPPPRGVVALDGKALRRGYERGMTHIPLHGLGLGSRDPYGAGQYGADGNNEAKAAQLIELLQLKGCVLSADALHCHRAMAKAMIDRGGDYVLAVKDNQPALLADAKAVIAAARSKGAKRLATAELNHGQAEKRSAVLATVKDMGQEHDFTALKAVACITSKRGSDDIVSRYFLISQPYSRTQMLRIVRQPWTIENCLHCRSMSCSTRISPATARTMLPPNLAILKRLALNVARAQPDTKISLRGKLKRAGWDGTYLFDMLSHMR